MPKKPTHSSEAKAAKKAVAPVTVQEDMGVVDAAPSPENAHPAHTSPAKMFHGRTVVSMVRHEGGPNPALRNKVVLKLSDLTETITSEEDLARVGIEAPAALE